MTDEEIIQEWIRSLARFRERMNGVDGQKKSKALEKKIQKIKKQLEFETTILAEKLLEAAGQDKKNPELIAQAKQAISQAATFVMQSKR